MGKVFLNAAFIFSFLLFISFCYAQKGTVTGTVLGIDGILSGATISVGTKTAVTNKFGKFSIALSPGNYTLQITYTGYKKISYQINLDDGNNIALQFTMTPDDELSEVVVLGSRFAAQRSNIISPVPVDVISSKQLLQTGQTNLAQMLQFTVPSLNASRQIVNEPVTLRGLDPDQVLILVNGKRYHNMAFLNWGGVRGILGRGAVSNDLNSIPFSAIEKIEVLRDGASAQYGSDAIAGVINIQLKNSDNKTWAQLHAGQFYKGDGETVSFGINKGVTFIERGFLNFSGAFRFQNPTYRGGVYKGTVYTNNSAADDSIIRARNFDRNKVSNAGTSKHTVFGLSMNGGYPAGKRTELFWTAGLNYRETEFLNSHTLPKNSSRINEELFPDGFKSRPGNHTRDIWGIAGTKGETKNKWLWEFSSAYGNNRGKYNNRETNNASQYFTLGKNAPTSFYTGSLIYGQLTSNLQFSKSFSKLSERKLNLALGAEWRLEHYQIKEGEEASWKNYYPSGTKQGGSGGLVLSPIDAIKENRNVFAAYVESESEFAKHFLVDLAVRYEYYSDYGSNLAGKLAARYKLHDKISVRASLSNGFRAPSLQQRYYSHTRVGIVNNLPVAQGIFRNNSPVAGALGIPSLQPERSVNISGGFTAIILPNIRMTADAYWIQIKNRIVLSGVFDRSVNQDVDSLLRGLTDVNQVQFFVNAINTRTKGLDIMLNGNWKIKKANLAITLGANFTQTRLFGEIKKAGNLKEDSLNTNTLYSIEEKTKTEEGQPSYKIILSGTYQSGKLKFLIRNTHFGKTAIAPVYTDPVTRVTSIANEFFSSKIITDISATYSLKKWVDITMGVNNIFNVYPDRLKDYRNTFEGIFIYSQEASPYGFNGGYYFVSMEYKW